MKNIVVGLGIQGQKRKRVAGTDCVATVDPEKTEADYAHVSEVPLEDYDCALVCLPDQPKYETLHYLLSHHKHVLVEKPLITPDREALLRLQALAEKNQLVLYTAYNHRFEPHLKQVASILREGALGKIYRCRLFYGNGTARLMRGTWRDCDSGVLLDLGSHLLDLIDYWFGDHDNHYQCIDAQCHENNAPDHVVVINREADIKMELTLSLLSWRNSFYADIIGEKGSVHVDSLCKWGPAHLSQRQRLLPSGRPVEKITTLVQDDNTWLEEYHYFQQMVHNRQVLSRHKDLWIYDQLHQLSTAAMRMANLCKV